MKNLFVFALVSIALMVAGCSTGESYVQQGYNFNSLNKVAVVDVQSCEMGEAGKNQIADFFVMEFLKKGYAPVERNQVQQLLREQQFQASDVTTIEGAARAGKVLNVPAVVIVNVPEFGENVSITAKLVNVEDASILWMGSGQGSTGKTLATIAGAAIGAGVGVAASGDDDQVVGGIVGGVLGGVAGNALSPKEAQSARKVVDKICVSLPNRIQ